MSDQIDEKKEVKDNWLSFTKGDVIHLFKYYMVLFTVSLSLVIIIFLLYALLWEDNLQVSIGILIFCVPSALLGSSIYYIRKLYKACIQCTIFEPDDGYLSEMRSLGTKVYFYSRPFISIALSMVIMFTIHIGTYALTLNNEFSSYVFFILCFIVSFCIGFFNGLFFGRLKNHASNTLDTLLKGNNSGSSL